MDEPDIALPGLEAPAKAEAYRVLARKYRPSDFTGLIGQEALVKTLSNAFATGRIAHAFMLTGVRGVGKTTTARIIARALNCIGPDGKRTEPTIHPCGVCEPCIAIAESRHVDVQEMDAASRTGIEDIREIIEGVRYAPASARYKVYIIDEVHMLSKQAFNGLLKTLEEPPPHVKFVFATTEIRKVPVTVLSRCQRFDLRRVETPELIAHLKVIAGKEDIRIEESALALIGRAAEGSVRDSLSLLDQAIAHGEGGVIAGEEVRAMLGLADRGRILDLFEKLMGGDIAAALTELGALYDRGADPLAVMQDLLETTHYLTRVKVAPGAEGFFDGGSTEAKRASALAAKLTVPALSRTWQLLLKGLFEVRDATRPLPAAEMALIRLAYAADLPPTDKLVRDLLDGDAKPRASAPSGGSSADGPRATMSIQTGGASAQRAPQPTAEIQNAPVLRSLEDVLALADSKSTLHTQIKNNVKLIRFEQGSIEFSLVGNVPAGFAGDLSQRLKQWTGQRWVVTVARDGGAPTIAEAARAKHTANLESVAQEPLVRAVLDRFPGAEIMTIHDRVTEDPPEAPVAEDS